MRYTGPKNRIARRENTDFGLKTPGSKSHASLLKRLNILPGQHGAKGRRKVSEHGRQLREKQKVRAMFGVTENQLKNYFQEAIKEAGNTPLHLTQHLERRLDNVVYRLALAPTRASARQLISHKHIKVNDRTMNIASYQVKVNDIITFAKEKSQKLPMIAPLLTKTDMIFPEWLEKKGIAGKMTKEPGIDILEKQINLRLVIEFYSK